MNRLKLERQKADELLTRNGLHSGQSQEPEQENERLLHNTNTSDVVYEIVANQLEKLSREVDKVLQYFASEMRGSVLDFIYIMGAASTIKDLDAYLEKRTGISTKHFNPAATLDNGGHELSNDNNNYEAVCGVPVGLAMRGLTEQDV
jgi:Tfp pilus assembly PilM family ATPase